MEIQAFEMLQAQKRLCPYGTHKPTEAKNVLKLHLYRLTLYIRLKLLLH